MILQLLFIFGTVFKSSYCENISGIYLAINALAFENNGEVVRRRLEVNWYGPQVMEDDKIVLLDEDGNEVSYFAPLDYPDNFIITDINVPYPNWDQMGFNRTCVFGYNVFWLRGDNTVASDCLQSEPSWMQNHRSQLGHLQIGDLMLPGSHDAGAFKEYEGIEDNNPVTAVVFAQEEDLLHQLIWGVRFLDVRCGFYPTTPERFWLVHGIIKTHPMQEGIEDVKTFLRNTREIIVWEVNEFEQVWDTAAHNEFKALLIKEFSDWLVKPGTLGWKTQLDDIWSQENLVPDQGRIIITYNDNRWFTEWFPVILERWGNKDDPEELREYIESEVKSADNNPHFQPWKPNCQMTPNTADIITGRWSGLREMADAVNRNMTKWWREEWSHLPSTFSIHDFIKSTNMIQEAIERNLRIANGSTKTSF